MFIPGSESETVRVALSFGSFRIAYPATSYDLHTMKHTRCVLFYDSNRCDDGHDLHF